MRNWGEASIYLKYLRRFRDDYMTVGTVLPGYIAQHETDAAASLTHKIKGVAGSLSLTDVARISAELNEAIEQGGDTSQLIAPFLEALERAQHSIDTYAGRGQLPAGPGGGAGGLPARPASGPGERGSGSD
nr:Hpt domain-containing protein [Aeromonas sp. QDB05]